jgi:hypothetical protein
LIAERWSLPSAVRCLAMSVSQDVGRWCAGDTVDEIVVHRWPAFRFRPGFLANTDPIRCCEYSHAARFSPAAIAQLVGDEPVAERGVVAVNVLAALIKCASSQSRWLTG